MTPASLGWRDVLHSDHDQPSCWDLLCRHDRKRLQTFGTLGSGVNLS
jgi:hypothetical protein